MNQFRMPLALLLGITVLTIQKAYSDSPTTGVSTISEKTSYEKISEKLALTYLGTYNGASILNLSNSLQPNVDGTPDFSSPQSLDSLITVGYKLEKNIMMGIVGRFMYYPIGNPTGTGHTIQGLDPALTFSKSNLITQGNFNLSAKLNFNLPVSQYDFLTPRHLATAFTPAAILNYDIPSTVLSVGLFTFVRGYIPTANSPDNVRTYKLYFGPNANFQFSKTLAATLWVDIEFNHNRGTGFFAYDNVPVDIQPGINWDISKNISINPVLNIYPSNMTLAATSLKANIVAKAF